MLNRSGISVAKACFILQCESMRSNCVQPSNCFVSAHSSSIRFSDIVNHLLFKIGHKENFG